MTTTTAPTTITITRWTEGTIHAYVYKVITLPSWSFALSADFVSQDLRRPVTTSPDGVVAVHSYVVPLGITVFPYERVSLRLGATYVSRNWLFRSRPTFARITTQDTFWIAEASLSYVLPKRTGKISAGITNALNTEFQNADFAENLVNVPSQSIAFARISLSF